MTSVLPLDTCAFAYGGAPLRGVLRAEPEHFFVEEILPFALSGEGEHVWLHIEKRNLTTLQLRDDIARLAGCRPFDVGFAGLKDKRAVTRQWFSVYLPAQPAIDWTALQRRDAAASVGVLRVERHSRKLRRGAHAGNRFELLATGVHNSDGGVADVDAVAQQVAAAGTPNYFGNQRFGHHGGNLSAARNLFACRDGSTAGRRKKLSRDRRSLLLSAARSWLFNQLLHARVVERSWNVYHPGDVLVLDGSHSFFDPLQPARVASGDGVEASGDDVSPATVEVELADVTATIASRLASGDVHVSAPLFGERLALADWERELLERHGEWLEGLRNERVDGARRALRLRPQGFSVEREAAGLRFGFSLPPGCFATVAIRELIQCDEPA